MPSDLLAERGYAAWRKAMVEAFPVDAGRVAAEEAMPHWAGLPEIQRTAWIAAVDEILLPF